MPLYEYFCAACDKWRVDMRTIAERQDGPTCDRCRKPMSLVISPVVGIVKNPAVPRRVR